MQQFDQIQEPPDCVPRRSSQSPLDIYQVQEYYPPPVPKPPRQSFSCFGRLLWIFWVVIIGVWIAMTLRYGAILFPESVLNPIRHPHSYAVFSISCVVASCCTLIFHPLLVRHPRLMGCSLLIFVFYALGLIVWFGLIDHGHPFSCENMTKKFPVYLELNSGMPASAKLYVNNTAYYGLTHERTNGKYHTYLSSEYLTFDPVTNKPFNKTWPVDTTVTSIWTSLRPTAGADGTVTGTCLGRKCLDGKFWMTPNLVFEWIYTNPRTGVRKKTRLASNEGKWYFGTRDRPLVALWGNGMEVFRAQSSTKVCTAGDGNLETSLVPVGLMLIAENIYKGI
jgi:hypothetical protein